MIQPILLNSIMRMNTANIANTINLKTNIDLGQINQLIESLDLRQTCISLKNCQETNDIIPCLVALIEQIDRLNNQYQKMWIFSTFRIGDLKCLREDIITLHQKLIWRLNINRFFSEPISKNI